MADIAAHENFRLWITVEMDQVKSLPGEFLSICNVETDQ